MLSRREFIQGSIVASAALGLDRLRSPAIGRTNGPTLQPPLTPFRDALRLPPVLRPQQQTGEGPALLSIRLRAGSQQLHSDLPPTPLWGYEGCFPGPTIEVRRGQQVRVEYINDLPADGEFPVTAVVAPNGTQGRAGRDGRAPDPIV